MTKRDETERLLRAMSVTAHRHTTDGWFCEHCGTECGASLVALCSCCADAYTGLAGEPEPPEAA